MTTTMQVGLQGFACEVSGEPVSFDECLACAQRGAPGCPMFPAAIEQIINTQRPADHAMRITNARGLVADFAFSVTEIVYCPRRYRLAREFPYHERPTALWRMLRGTAIHDFLAASSHGIREQTLVWRFRYRGKVIVLVGTPDLIVETERGYLVVDYKFTDFAPRPRAALVCNGCQAEVSELCCPNCGPLHREQVSRLTLPPRPHNGHEWQVGLYGLLVEQAMKGEVCGGQVIYLTKKPLKVEVPYSREAALNFLKSRLDVLAGCALPPVLTEPQELWQCDYCSLSAVCRCLPSADGSPQTADR